MTWPAAFRSKLYSGGVVHQALLLECLMPANGEGVGDGGWFAATDPSLSPWAELLHKQGFEPRLGSTGINPQTWQPIEGGWSVTIKVADGLVEGEQYRRAGLEYAARALRKGALLRLSIGEVGYSRSEYQALKIGRIAQVSSDGHPNLLKIEVWDLTTGIRTRLAATGASADERSQLFYGSAGQLDTLSADYTVGDGSISITGATTDRFLRETGGNGAVRITPDVGDDFWLTFTGETTGTLTGLSSTGAFGTTAGDATTGRAVGSTVLLEGHPIDILRKILTSTGAGTNGSFDTLPASWGLGIPSDMLSDYGWSQAKRILSLTAGSYDWRILLETEIPDPAAWIVSIWGSAGIWLTTKEGQLVPRMARELHTVGLARQFGDLTDSDLIEVPGISWHPADVPEVYHTVKVIHSAGFSSHISNVTTLPAREVIEYNITDQTLGVSNADDIANETRDRLKGWGHFVPEYVEATVYGLRSYATGDVIQLSTAGVRGRLTLTRYGYENRLVMVVREEMDLSENATRLTLATLPINVSEDSTQ
jgi:hypothetical protein